jgi:hypothetical protein
MSEDPQPMPGWLTLTGGVMALMSACAHPRPDLPPAEAERLRRLMAHKLLASLRALHGHPQAPPALRRVAAQVHRHWQALLLPAPAADTRVPACLVHAAPPQMH